MSAIFRTFKGEEAKRTRHNNNECQCALVWLLAVMLKLMLSPALTNPEENLPILQHLMCLESCCDFFFVTAESTPITNWHTGENRRKREKTGENGRKRSFKVLKRFTDTIHQYSDIISSSSLSSSSLSSRPQEAPNSNAGR